MILHPILVSKNASRIQKINGFIDNLFYFGGKKRLRLIRQEGNKLLVEDLPSKNVGFLSSLGKISLLVSGAVFFIPWKVIYRLSHKVIVSSPLSSMPELPFTSSRLPSQELSDKLPIPLKQVEKNEEIPKAGFKDLDSRLPSQELSDKLPIPLKQVEKNEEIPRTGFKNLGSTCYIASALVALRPTYETIKESKHFKAKQQLLELYRNPTSDNFKNFIESKDKDRGLMSVVNKLGDPGDSFQVISAINRLVKYSSVLCKFNCSSCHKNSEAEDDSIVPFRGRNSLTTAVTENLEKFFDFDCQSCHKENGKASVLFSDYLILGTGSMRITIKPDETEIIYRNYKFEPVSCLVDKGGHAVAYVLEDGEWFYYDDDVRQKACPEIVHAVILKVTTTLALKQI